MKPPGLLWRPHKVLLCLFSCDLSSEKVMFCFHLLSSCPFQLVPVFWGGDCWEVTMSDCLGWQFRESRADWGHVPSVLSSPEPKDSITWPVSGLIVGPFSTGLLTLFFKQKVRTHDKCLCLWRLKRQNIWDQGTLGNLGCRFALVPRILRDPIKYFILNSPPDSLWNQHCLQFLDGKGAQ